MKSMNPARAGASLLALTGVIHLALAPEYLGEQAYIGLLFIAGGIVSLALAARLWSRPRPADLSLIHI